MTKRKPRTEDSLANRAADAAQYFASQYYAANKDKRKEKWDYLPNAAHIYRVLESLAANPKLWAFPWDPAWGPARSTAQIAATYGKWDRAWKAAWKEARDAAAWTKWHPAWKTGRYPSLGADRDPAFNEASDTAQGALLALLLWDDCAMFLDMPPDAVKLFGASGNHAAMLLWPAAVVFSKQSVSFTN